MCCSPGHAVISGHDEQLQGVYKGTQGFLGLHTDYTHAHRTFNGVQLKDKWRNIIKFRHVKRLSDGVAALQGAVPSQSTSDQTQSPAIPIHSLPSSPASHSIPQHPTADSGVGRYKRRRNRSRATEAVEDTRFGIYDQRRYVTRGELEQRQRQEEGSHSDDADVSIVKKGQTSGDDPPLGYPALMGGQGPHGPHPPGTLLSSLPTALPSALSAALSTPETSSHVQPNAATHLATLLQLLQPPPCHGHVRALPTLGSPTDPGLIGLLQLMLQQQQQQLMASPFSLASTSPSLLAAAQSQQVHGSSPPAVPSGLDQALLAQLIQASLAP